MNFTLLREHLHSVLGTLSEREAGVVSMRYGLTDGHPKTLEEIGKAYGGLSRERVAHIQNWTIDKLRHPSRQGAFATTWISKSLTPSLREQLAQTSIRTRRQ